MSDIPPEKETSGETKPPAESVKTPGPVGQRSIQGYEPEQAQPNRFTELTTSDPALKAELDDWKRTHDPANWEYKHGSPHADHQLNEDLEQANRQNAINQQAATANSLPEAIVTTWGAHHNANDQSQAPADRYFHEKYGYQPYTEDAYPKKDEEEQKEE